MKTKDNRNHKNYTYEQIRKIQNIFIDNKQNIDVKGTIEYFDKVYVRQLSKFTNIDNKTLCDCACGYGWFSFAYLLNGENNKAIGIDIDMKKIEIAKYISEILELSDRVRFKNANITQLPLNSNSIDIFASIETLEHVGDKGDQLLRILARKQKKKKALRIYSKCKVTYN